MENDYDNSHAGQCGYRNAEFRSNRDVHGESRYLIRRDEMTRHGRLVQICRSAPAADQESRVMRGTETARTNDCLFPFGLQLPIRTLPTA